MSRSIYYGPRHSNSLSVLATGRDGACPKNVPKERAYGASKCKECKVCNGENLRKNAKVLIDKDPGIRFPSWGLRVRIPSPAPIHYRKNARSDYASPGTSLFAERWAGKGKPTPEEHETLPLEDTNESW